MKILIGSILKWGKKGVLALEIPGIGVIEAKDCIGDDAPFSCIELDKEQLVNLRNQIDKELSDGKENSME